jgi:hypothetical protein
MWLAFGWRYSCFVLVLKVCESSPTDAKYLVQIKRLTTVEYDVCIWAPIERSLVHGPDVRRAGSRKVGSSTIKMG